MPSQSSQTPLCFRRRVVLALLSLVLPLSAGAQCPSPLLYEIGGPGYAIFEGISGYQTVSRGRTVQVIQTNINPPQSRGSVTLDHVVVDLHEAITGQTYAIDDHTLYALDTSNTNSPQVVGRLTIPGVPTLKALKAKGSFVYITDETSLHIVDVSNRAAPMLRSSFTSTDTHPLDVEVIGSYAYVGVWTSGLAITEATFIVLDVSNPVAPAEVHRILGRRALRMASGIGFGNPYLYAYVQRSGGENHIERYSIANPIVPVLQATSSGDIPWSGFDHDRLRVGQNAVVALTTFEPGFEGLHFYDPITLAESALSTGAPNALSMEVDSTTAYISTTTGVVHKVDFSSLPLRTISFNFLDAPPGIVNQIGGNNNGFTVMCGQTDGWVLTDPASGTPTPLYHALAPAFDRIEHVLTLSDLIFLDLYDPSAFSSSILAYRYTGGPPNVTFLGSITLSGHLYGMDYGTDDGGTRRLYATVLDSVSPTAVLHIINANNLASMSVTSSTALTSGVRGPLKFLSPSFLFEVNGRVLVGGDTKIQIVSVLNPGAPSPLGVIDAGATALGASFSTVWAVDHDTLKAFDISTPAAPVLTSSVKLPGIANNFAFINPFAALACVATENGKLVSINTQNPAALSLYQISDIGFPAGGLTWDGTLLHVANESVGYRVFQTFFSAPPAEDPNFPLAPVTICPGNPVTLAAAFVAQPAVSLYQWFRNGVAVTNGPTGHGSSYSGATTATLTISGAQAADAGTYRCDATNSCGPTSATAQVSACYANCDCSTTAPTLNALDFTCFLQKFAAADPYANCDNSTQPPTLNALDFTCFLQRYAAGCP